VKEAFTTASEKVTIVAKLSDDRLKLFITAECKSAGSTISKGDLVSLLVPHVPGDLLNLGVLDDIAVHLSKGEKVEDRRVVKGVEPEAGADARLVFLVKRYAPKPPAQKSAPEENETCFLSLRDLHLFDNVKSGMVVARLYPPKSGKAGTDALGKPLPAKAGQPVKLQLDKTLTQRNEAEGALSYQAVVASTDGYLVEESGKLMVKEELAITGNVDFHVGNLEFIGQLVVKGDVLPGFSVSGVKGVTIIGAVQGGSVSSSQGSVTVKGFVFGGDTGKIVCRGDFSCITARQAQVEALGNITISKEAYDCTLRSQKSIVAEGGRLIGGQHFAVCGAHAQQFGNDVGHTTTIDLCSDVEMTTEYASLIVAIEAHRKTQQLLELHLGPYATNQTRLRLLPPDYRAKLERLLKKKRDVAESLVALLAKQSRLLGNAHSNSEFRVNFGKVMHQGVTIRAGGEKHVIQESLKGPGSIEYQPNEKKFVVGELKALTCTPAKTPAIEQPKVK